MQSQGQKANIIQKKNPLEDIEVLSNGERGLRLDCASSGVSGPPEPEAGCDNGRMMQRQLVCRLSQEDFTKLCCAMNSFEALKKVESHLYNTIQNLCSVLQKATMTCICGDTVPVSAAGGCGAIPPKSETTVTKLPAAHPQGSHD